MRISRSTGVFSGLLLLALGLWGALIPFIGPYFHYAFGGDTTWHYTTQRLLLDILPGVTVMLGALIMLWTGHRLSGATGGWLAIIGGAWFVVGSSVSGVWHHTWAIGAPYGGSARQMLEWVGYFYGLGALIIALAAFALGRFIYRPALVVEPEPEPTMIAEAAPYDPVAVVPNDRAAVTPADPAAVRDQPVTVVPDDSTAPRRPTGVR
jgi:hypothetical protein